MAERFDRFSTVTGKMYNVFDCVKILNIRQVSFYMHHEINPVDIKVTKNDKGENCLVFYYIKDETKEVYEQWLDLRKRGQDL